MTKKMSLEEFEAKWRELLSLRGNKEDEVTRLTSILYGFLYRHNTYAKASRRNDYYDAQSFWASKRPYGNKHVEMSIAFNLGWDKNRELWDLYPLPNFVEEEARELHKLVLIEIQEEDDFISSVRVDNF